MTAPSVIEHQLIFTVDDPGRAFVRVGLDCDDAVVGQRRFRRTKTGWALAIPRPDLARLEYRLVVTARDGSTQVVCDPANPERVGTAFGERSVALMPGYERPLWLQHVDDDKGPADDATEALVHVDPELGHIPVEIWSPPTVPPDREAYLLVVNDGPEYAELASLTKFCAWLNQTGELPPFRVALFQPMDRDEWYAGNPDYVVAVKGAVDEVRSQWATTPGVVAMGASLGGLSAVLTALSYDDEFVGAFSQSGSFFTPQLDPQESTYPYFEQVAGAVSLVLEASATSRPLRISLTCGAHEENLDNNVAVAAALSSSGHHVEFREVPDLHNYTAWRDSLHPSLSDLLRSVWVRRG